MPKTTIVHGNDTIYLQRIVWYLGCVIQEHGWRTLSPYITELLLKRRLTHQKQNNLTCSSRWRQKYCLNISLGTSRQI